MKVKPGCKNGAQPVTWNILGAVEGKPSTLPQYAMRRGNQGFGIFGTFPDEPVGPNLRMPLARNIAMLVRPPGIHRTDMLMGKE